MNRSKQVLENKNCQELEVLKEKYENVNFPVTVDCGSLLQV